jgi:hypothetical protein
MSLTIKEQIDRLQDSHRKMEEAIEERINNPQLKFMVVDLKKKKLKLKEQIEELKTHLT